MAVVVHDVDAGVPIPVSGGVAGLKMVIKTFDFDSSYPTNGELLSAADMGLTTVLFLHAQATGGYVFEYDIATGKLKAFWVDTTVDGAAMAQVVDTTTMATITGVRIIAWGT